MIRAYKRLVIKLSFIVVIAQGIAGYRCRMSDQALSEGWPDCVDLGSYGVREMAPCDNLIAEGRDVARLVADACIRHTCDLRRPAINGSWRMEEGTNEIQ